MSIEEIRTYVESLPGVLTVAPGPGDPVPETVHGDLFFYYAPDGEVPAGQPFATVVTKDYPGEPPSGLGDGVFRVNVDAGRRGQPPCADPAVRDQVMAHPTYGHLGWVCVVAPGPQTAQALERLVLESHRDAERRWRRRVGALPGGAPGPA